MFGLKRVHIARHERGLLFHERSFAGVLQPGVRWIFDPLRRTEVEVRDLTIPEFEHPQLDFVLAATKTGTPEHFHIVELEDREVGLVYKNGKIAGILAPGKRQLYWRGPVDVHVVRYDISTDFEIPAGIAQVLVRARQPLASQVAEAVTAVEVPDTTIGLLMVDGELVKVLGPGLHAFWKFQRAVRVELVDRRVQAMEVAGQDLLTRDWVNLRIGLVALWQVLDVVRARSALTNFVDFAYKELQFALREAVGNRTLDEVLADRGLLDREIGAAAHAKVAEHGLAIHSVGVKDVTLLNTAPLMDESPTLLRLRQLTTSA
jgi:SPFH domain / Band 7 family